MSKLSKILIGIVVAILLIFLVSYFGKSSDSDTGTITTEVGTAQSGDAKYILTLLNKMSQVSLKDTLFSDSSFIRLKDNSVTLVPQPISRENPFAPVSPSELSAPATTTPR